MTAPQTGFASVNGTRLFYEVAGHGQPLVLIHGFGLDHRLWDEQFRDYARRFRVLRYDLRGFGRSDVPGDQPYQHADDLRALLDHFGMDQAVLVGLSLGGFVALNAGLSFPSRVSALVLVAPFLNGRAMSPEWDAEVAPIWREARALGVEAAKERWHQIRLFEATRAHPQAGPRLAAINSAWSGWQFLHRDPENTPAPVNNRLNEVRAPTLIVIGERDLPDFQAIARELLAIPLARRATVPGAGHLPPLEAPSLFDALVLGFLDALEP
jgi:pimeloyl-ACP methyl ester carboxylesterase